ncbi:MAG: ribosome-associated translation inhibitor RaiA [Coriobacteriia bacterium]|nr:ribosome-associated translation inhibitor RaiA [Coriobacteriia bacterium]
MNITITGRKMAVTERTRDYALEKIGDSCKVMDIDPLDAEVVLHVEKNRSNPRLCCCEVTLRAKNHIIRVEESDEDMLAAIDVAAAKVERQLRKFKTKVVDRRVQVQQEAAIESRSREAGEELDLDALMADLAAEDEEIVRVKEIEFVPMTEEQALIQIDLLGHDFFAYTDRDTNLVNVLYRRNNGGYGLLKQKD